MVMPNPGVVVAVMPRTVTQASHPNADTADAGQTAKGEKAASARDDPRNGGRKNRRSRGDGSAESPPAHLETREPISRRALTGFGRVGRSNIVGKQVMLIVARDMTYILGIKYDMKEINVHKRDGTEDKS